MICENCFGDKFLAEHIRAKGSDTVAECVLCGSLNVRTIDPSQLYDFVSSVVSLYIQSNDEDANKLIFYLKRDWGLLKAPDETASNEILDAIFVGEELSNKKFKSKQSQTSRINLWDDFQSELKHRNRFFPKTKIIDLDDLKDLFGFLIFKAPPTVFFRARICENKEAFGKDKMGKPPELLTKGGRANPIGISYLYTASDPQTSIAEVRPNVGDLVTVARITPSQELTLLDLRNPREISPFAIDADNLLKLLNDLEFLCRLGDQLSKAILPREADLEYLASQYLCEMIKHFNYDGVVYRSSVSQGFNIAFFDDSKLVCNGALDLYKVSAVQYLAEIQT